jgi:dTDP-4-dehydrorhamnose reductase
MRILVVGALGMLGSDVVKVLAESGRDVAAYDLAELDITNPDSVAETLTKEPYQWCVNCAAYTAVDAAETNVDLATAVNTLGPGYLARACMASNTRLIHISTDFVFDGNKHEPYTEEDVPNPLGIYGHSKLEGEESLANSDAIILRTAWLFGPNGKSFPRTMIEAARAGKSLRVVADQIGSPTYTIDLAKTIAEAIESNLVGGLYHAAGPDIMSWHDFATLVIQEDRRQQGDPNPVDIAPIQTQDWPTPAKRPKYSALDSTRLHKAGITPMPPIQAGIEDFVSRLFA